MIDAKFIKLRRALRDAERTADKDERAAEQALYEARALRMAAQDEFAKHCRNIGICSICYAPEPAEGFCPCLGDDIVAMASFDATPAP